MIKLVITDLDGTLLTAERNLPKDTFDVVKKLKEKGILFGAASGRQLGNLRELFAPVESDMAFIAENGALGWFRRKMLFCKRVPPSDVQKTLKVVRETEGLFPLLCSPECAYYENLEQPFERYVNASYTATAQADLDDVAANKSICKIAIYDALGAERHGAKLLPAALPNLRVIQSGMDWLDVCEHGVNKGTALTYILKELHISPEECMAFGDHMNDFEMLAACAHPRVPENAYFKLKEAFPVTVPSNTEEGVIQALKQLLQEQ